MFGENRKEHLALPGGRGETGSEKDFTERRGWWKRLEIRRKIGDESSRGTKGHSKKDKDITRPTSESIGKNATTDYWAGQPEHKKGGLEGDSTTQRALGVLYLEPTAVPSRPSSELESGGQNKNTQIAISVQFCLPAISETTQ